MSGVRLSERRADGFLWVFIGVYFIVFSYIAFVKLTSFSFNDFDLAINEQILWNIGRGPFFESMHNSILGTQFLGNHMHLILFFLAPLYKLVPHAMTLLVAQTAALGLGAWPLYLLAKRVLGPTWALLVAAEYLFYPPLAYVNLFEFHPVAFSTVFLLSMLYFYHQKRFVPFVVFMGLAMICQENIPLGVGALGIYSWVARRPKRWILTPLIGGLAYFLVVVIVLLPFFNRNTLQFLSLYSHLGKTYPEILAHILTRPLEILKLILQPHKLVYLVQLFGPLLFVPFLDSASLIPAVPLFLQHLLSNRVNDVLIVYHYTAELIPFIFTAFVFGLKRLLSFKKKPAGSSVGLGVCFCLMALAGSLWLGPHFSLPKLVRYSFKDAKDSMKEDLLKKVPPEASVAATFEFLPFLTHRRELYSFHHVYWGLYTMSTRPYELPKDVRYALIDFNDRLTFMSFLHPLLYQNLQRFLREGPWKVADASDSIILFEKGEETEPLYGIGEGPAQPQVKMSYGLGGDLEFLGYDVRKRDEGLEFVFYWHCLRRTGKDMVVFFHLVDEQGQVLYETFLPLCYRLYPTYAWQEGQVVWERKFLPSPAQLKAPQAKWKMGFFNALGAEVYLVNPQDMLGRIDLEVPS